MRAVAGGAVLIENGRILATGDAASLQDASFREGR